VWYGKHINTLIKNCSTQKAVNNAQNVIFVARFDYLTPILNTQKDFSSLFKAQKYLVGWHILVQTGV
jgi:hypothetical protein